MKDVKAMGIAKDLAELNPMKNIKINRKKKTPSMVI